MKTMIIILVFMGLFVWRWMRGTSRMTYNTDMSWIEHYILFCPVTAENFMFILNKWELIVGNNKDKKRTKKAWFDFTQKYYVLYSKMFSNTEVRDIFLKLNKKINL